MTFILRWCLEKKRRKQNHAVLQGKWACVIHAKQIVKDYIVATSKLYMRNQPLTRVLITIVFALRILHNNTKNVNKTKEPIPDGKALAGNGKVVYKTESDVLSGKHHYVRTQTNLPLKVNYFQDKLGERQKRLGNHMLENFREVAKQVDNICPQLANTNSL
jgi:hypothetical protein